MFFQKQKNNFYKVFESTISCIRNGRFFRSSVLLLALFSFSCGDQGCIEADDFGEYDTQTIEILANSSGDSCTYDYTKEMTDSSQGQGIKTCLISGNVSIFDENGVNQVSSSGCKGLPGDKFKNLCIDQCVSNCNGNIGSSLSISSEPSWIATNRRNAGQNGGVTLKPNSEISIRTIGSINLGSKFSYPTFFVAADDYLPQSRKTNWENQRLDVGQGKSISIFFSGKFTDGSIANGGSTQIGQVGAGSSSLINDQAYNAARRLVAYMIAQPQGYDFDNSQTDEKAGSRGVPLLADANLWQCSYSATGANIEKQSTCSNKSYSNNGYPNVDDASVNGVYPISSDFKVEGLGTYGGMVRWNNDGLLKDSTDPFSGVLCDNPACPNAINNQQGRIVGDNSSSDVSITAPVSGKLSLKFLLSSDACNATYDVLIKDTANNILYTYTSLNISNASWSNTQLNGVTPVTKHIAIEKNQILTIKQKAQSYTSTSGSATSCGRAMAVKFIPYHDIAIEKSGIVSFAMLNGASAAGCVIKGRIINPNGTHSDTNPTADFYEYANFNEPSIPSGVHDPFENLAVPATTLLTNFDSAVSGMAPIFVRKGQKIRFSPESWNGTWNAEGGARDCGIGMAMRIIPRPALLCRGYGDDHVLNPGCTMKFDANGALIGCDEVAAECNDSGSSSYCPNSQCIKPVTCANGNAANFYTRTACALGSIPATDAAGTCNQSGAGYTLAKCDSCSEARLNNAQIPAYLSKTNMVQCYDLEKYRGKVDNIPNSGGETEVNSFLAGNMAKGAIKLDSFNGEYGNFKDFTSTGKTDSIGNNTIFQVSQPINLVKPGRLKFMILDGDSFLNLNTDYSNNTSRGAGYNGANGFKIETSSMLEFSNGEWLEIILCKETDANTVACRSDDRPTPVSGQSRVVELADPTGGSFTPQTTTAFKLDNYGSLLRFQPRLSTDCTKALVGDNYYCHTDTADDVNLLKLSFKIKDPEPANCNINDPTSNTGFTGIITTNNNYRPNDCNTSDPEGLLNLPEKNGISGSDGNGNRTCTANSGSGQYCTPSEGASCTKEFRCVNKYSNNSGKYYATVRVKTEGSNISEIVNDVITPVVEVMDGTKDGKKIGQAERIYKLIIGDPRYQALLSMSLVLMYSFYGLGYLMGVNDAGIKDMVNKIIKISLIYFFVSPQGWEWFDTFAVKLFKNGTDYLAFLMASSFDDSPALQSAINNFDFYDKSILFGSVDKVFGIFFSQTVQKKVSALLFASIFGWAYLLIIYYGILLYVYAVANAVLLYLTSQVFISILFVLGPIFFIFTLFNQTKDMFDNWLKQLIGFSLQQIFLLTTLAFFNMMMYEVIKLALGYKICWDEVWTINIIIRITLMSFWTIASLPPRTSAQTDAGNIGNTDGIPSLFSILFIWVIAGLMLQFITFMTDLASSIAGGLSASSMGEGVKKAAQALQKGVGDKAGKFWKATGGKKLQQLDKALFDSGELADKERKAKKDKIAADFKNKKKMGFAGDDAIKDYKKKHAAELAGKSKDEQIKILRDVKDKAMTERGLKEGLSENEIKRLKNDKGSKYVGENVFGLTAKMARQAVTRGGTAKTSLAEEKIDTSYSTKEMKSASKNKNTDTEGRKAIDAGIDKGNLVVRKSGLGALKQAPKNMAKAVANPFVKAGRFFHDKKYDEATKQLEAEGEINTMAKGTNWARPKEEKDKIIARAKTIANEKDASLGKFTSTGTKAKLKEHFQDQEDLKESGASGNMRAAGGISSIIGRKKVLGTMGARKAAREADSKAAAKARGGVLAAKVDERLKDVYAQEADEEHKREDVQDDIDAIHEDPHFQKMLKQEGSGDEAKAREARNDPTYAKQNAALKTNYANMQKIQGRQQNLAQQRKGLEKTKGLLEEAGEISDFAARSNNTEVADKYKDIISNYDENSVDKLESFVKEHPMTEEERRGNALNKLDDSEDV